MDINLKNNKRNNTLVNIIFFILCLALGLFSAFNYDHSIKLYLYLGLCFLYIVLSFILAVIIHELGHMVFGFIDGYKLHYFQSLFLKFYADKNSNKIKFKFVAPVFLGQCIMKFDGDPLKQKYKRYMYGGALFNLFCFIICIFIVGIYYILNNELILFPLYLAFINCYLFLSNGIPLRIQNVDNDALNLKIMNKYDEAKICVLNSLKLQLLQDNDASINEIDEDLINNTGYEIPKKYVNGYLFVLLRTIKKIVNDEENPYSELKEVFELRSHYPLIYKSSMVSFILFNNLFEDREYRGIYHSNEFKFVFKNPDKRDPIIFLITSLIDYKKEVINKEELIKKINDNRELITPKKLNKIECELYSKLFDNTLNYILSKEMTTDASISDPQQ